MSWPLGIEPVEREAFANPPLKTIIAQVRYTPRPELVEREPPQVLRDAYPAVRQVTGDDPHWRLTSSDGWAVALGADFLTVEAEQPRRVRYVEVRDRLVQTAEEVGALRVQQVGLRYINHIQREHLDYDWSRAVNPALLGMLARPGAQQALEVSVNHWLFRVPAGLLALNHGLMRLGERDALGYLLDFDCTSAARARAAPERPLDAVLDELHETIAPLFRWCVGPDALEEFRRPAPTGR